MAESVMPKIKSILSKLAILEDKMDAIKKHMCNVDKIVINYRRKSQVSNYV